MTQDGCDSHSQERNRPVDQDLDELSSPPSNKKLLCIAFVSFQSFAIVQIGAALYAGSEAMLGDSVAMMVDALTYLFNLVAERQKEVYASKLKHQNKLSSSPMTAFTRNKMVLEYRKYTYQLELIPPLLSVATLMVVTVLVLKESIHTLILDSERDASLQSDPNVDLMVIFSFFNLLLDVVNVGCFASANHALGYKTDTGENDQADVDTGNTTTTEAIQETCHRFERDNPGADNDIDGIEICDDNSEEIEMNEFDTEAASREPHDCDDRFKDDITDDSTKTNLNMCSAYTVSKTTVLWKNPYTC